MATLRAGTVRRRRRTRFATIGVAVVVISAAGVTAGCTAAMSGSGHPAVTGTPGVSGRLVPLTSTAVLFFGDSWTRGIGAASPSTQGYVQATATALHWKATTVSDPGGGYVTKGIDGMTYLQQLTATPTSLVDPALVVLQGGLNDHVDPDPQAIASGYAAVVALAHQKWPHAQLVTLGPMSPLARIDTAVATVDSALAHAAATAGVPYIDADKAGWLPDAPASHGLLNPSNNHPNADGYRLIAGKLAAALQQLGV